MNETGSTSYPGDYTNSTTPNDHFFKDHTIMNHPAGYLEFLNSKGIEQVNLIHKNGSGIMLTPRQFSLISTKNFKANFLSDVTLETKGDFTIHVDKDLNITHLGDSFSVTGDADKWQKYMEGIANDLKPIHNKKQLFETQRTKFHNSVDQSSLQKKNGVLAPCPTDSIGIKIIKTDDPMKWTPYAYGPCSRTLAILEDGKDSFNTYTGAGGLAPDDGWFCLTCHGTKESPSTQDGNFLIEKIKSEIEKDMVELTTTLSQKEKFLGQNKKPSGGDSYNTVSKNKIEIIGLTFNNLNAVRVDPVGRLIPNNITVDPFGSSVYKSYRASALIERVHVDDHPGGDLVVNVGNSYKLNVGSNGIDIKTSGNLDLFGSTMRMTSQQIQLGSRLNMEITSGDSMFISSPNIVIKPVVSEFEIEDSKGNVRALPANGKNKTEQMGQLLVDGNLGVAGNTIIKGGLHIEGEVTLHHLTMPMEMHITEEDFEFGKSKNCASDILGEDLCAEDITKGPTYADIVEGCLIAYCHIGGGSSAGTWPVYSVCAPSSVLVHPHHHYMKMPAMRLFRDSEEVKVTYGNLTQTKEVMPHDMVRAVGARNNSIKPLLAKPVKNSKTNDTVHTKFGNSNCGEPLTIVNSDWEEFCANDTLPKGSGINTVPDSALLKNYKSLDSDGVKSVEEVNKILEKCSDERKNHESFYSA